MRGRIINYWAAQSPENFEFKLLFAVNSLVWCKTLCINVKWLISVSESIRYSFGLIQSLKFTILYCTKDLLSALVNYMNFLSVNLEKRKQKTCQKTSKVRQRNKFINSPYKQDNKVGDPWNVRDNLASYSYIQDFDTKIKWYNWTIIYIIL